MSVLRDGPEQQKGIRDKHDGTDEIKNSMLQYMTQYVPVIIYYRQLKAEVYKHLRQSNLNKQFHRFQVNKMSFWQVG